MDDHTQTQINELINATIPVAEGVLARQENFDPFAAYLDHAGDVKLIAPWTGPEERTDEEQVAYFRKVCMNLLEEGEATAVSVVYDAILTAPGTGEQRTAIMNSVVIPPAVEWEIAAFYTRDGDEIVIQQIARIK